MKPGSDREYLRPLIEGGEADIAAAPTLRLVKPQPTRRAALEDVD